jgi:hypothetical protein
MLAAGGFRLVSVSHTGEDSLKRRLVRVMTRDRATEFFAYQWVLLASPT